MPSSHALLSPSAAHRWLNCTAAPLLEENVQDNAGEYAIEGTLAHAYCAKKLKTFLHLPTDDEDAEIEQYAQYHTGEMDEYTDVYMAIVLERLAKARRTTPDAKLLVEVRLDLRKYIPDAFGTSDAIIIADDVIEVIDFKYGKGVKVSAVENEQMKIYALGALEEFGFDYNINDVTMTIVQPRIDNLSDYTISERVLRSWGEKVLAPKAVEAYKGGTQKAGDWCKFCKVRAFCRTLAKKCSAAAAKSQYDAKLLSTDDIAHEVLPILPLVKLWVSGVEDYTLQQALSGVHFDGYKLVEGRSIRKITDTNAVITRLEGGGYKREDVIKPTELRSLTELEKLTGKKKFAELCGEYIYKPQGKPTLVEEDDKRQAINPIEDDFKNVDLNNN